MNQRLEAHLRNPGPLLDAINRLDQSAMTRDQREAVELFAAMTDRIRDKTPDRTLKEILTDDLEHLDDLAQRLSNEAEHIKLKLAKIK